MVGEYNFSGKLSKSNRLRSSSFPGSIHFNSQLNFSHITQIVTKCLSVAISSIAAKTFGFSISLLLLWWLLELLFRYILVFIKGNIVYLAHEFIQCLFYFYIYVKVRFCFNLLSLFQLRFWCDLVICFRLP